MIITTYKDYEIDCNWAGEFSALEVDGKHETLNDIKAAIDKALKIKYQKIEGLIVNSITVAIKHCTITRPASSQITRNYMWVTYDDKRRETTYYAFPRTLENVQSAIRVIEINKQVSKLERERRTLIEGLEKVDIETWVKL